MFEDAYLSTHVIAERPHCRVTHSCLLLMIFLFFFFFFLEAFVSVSAFAHLEMTL